MKIGFDFDKVFVNYPPLIPDFLIDKLYKRKNHKLTYRFPDKLEQKIRILSHHPILRQQIKENVTALSKIAKEGTFEIYLVSGRFGFLKDRTRKFLEKYDLNNYFKGIFFNFENEQPHLFKEKTLKKLGIKKFIDDDIDLLFYLSEKIQDIELYWLNSKKPKDLKLPRNIRIIKNLDEFREKHL